MIAALFQQEVSINETACLDNLGLCDCQKANDANTAEIQFLLYTGGLKKFKKGGKNPQKKIGRKKNSTKTPAVWMSKQGRDICQSQDGKWLASIMRHVSDNWPL